METVDEKTKKGIDRRLFLKNAGIGAMAAAALIACKKKSDDPAPQNPDPQNPSANEVNLGSGDTGVLNYAYALEQLEAAFYTRVVTGSLTGTSAGSEFMATFPDAMERTVLQDLMAHEIAHREAFKALLKTSAIKGLTPDFSAIDFKSRASVLAYAKTFEDLGVAAYNGAGRLLTNSDYLVIAGKIVSVEARHASAIRDILNPKENSANGFSGTADQNGLDPAMSPAEVLKAAQAFVVEKINGNNLPK